MNFVAARRLEKWPDDDNRSEASRMLAEGASLGEVLRSYPDAVPNSYRSKPVEPARRAIYAHYALLQELQGEPDIDPAEGAIVEKIIRNQGIESACVRTGSSHEVSQRMARPALVPQPGSGVLDNRVRGAATC